MDIRLNWSRSQRFLRLLVVLTVVIPSVCLARRQNGLQPGQPSETLIQQRISLLIHQTIQQSRINLKNGVYATVMPVKPSSADLREVKGYGDSAVKVLAGYVNSTSAMEQHVAFRFLADFPGDTAFEAINSFAERSAFGDVRQEATVDLAGFPEDKVKSILERISSSDSDPGVRAAAGRALLHFRPAQGRQQE